MLWMHHSAVDVFLLRIRRHAMCSVVCGVCCGRGVIIDCERYAPWYQGLREELSPCTRKLHISTLSRKTSHNPYFIIQHDLNPVWVTAGGW